MWLGTGAKERGFWVDKKYGPFLTFELDLFLLKLVSICESISSLFKIYQHKFWDFRRFSWFFVIIKKIKHKIKAGISIKAIIKRVKTLQKSTMKTGVCLSKFAVQDCNFTEARLSYPLFSLEFSRFLESYFEETMPKHWEK